MPERSDEELMTAYAGGEIAAFEALYQRYRGPLYRFVLRQVGDPATANDLYQGSWEKIIAARGRYRERAPFRAWIYRITRNHVTDYFRRSRPTLELQPERLESPDPGPEAALSASWNSERLEAALDGLPGEQKEARLLKLEAGLGLQEIAEVVGVNPETAKSRLRYAVAKLKAELAETAGDTAG